MDKDEEAYLLLLLSDGNLPTGSFVASAGLESYVTHGFFNPLYMLADTPRKNKLEYVADFIRDSISAYGNSALAFVSDAHVVVQQAIQSGSPSAIDDILRSLLSLDDLYETTTLNHITRRASTTQGVALLSLYSKGFSKPTVYVTSQHIESPEDGRGSSGCAGLLVDKLKLIIRRGETAGHLPICWGVLTAALGLSLERSQFMHLFLCARGILSAAVRLNICGPYAAQQLLLHAVQPIVKAEASRCADLRTGLRHPAPIDGIMFDEEILMQDGPSMTWPLGEILAARHDLQHSRVFNS
ncbi:hypothetical protein BDW22DRAFT_1378387 [Trametopsis cervina]|nr:hypothetical protein BDW22DRAFT_1378387 [Trametopsis cervina]